MNRPQAVDEVDRADRRGVMISQPWEGVTHEPRPTQSRLGRAPTEPGPDDAELFLRATQAVVHVSRLAAHAGQPQEEAKEGLRLG